MVWNRSATLGHVCDHGGIHYGRHRQVMTSAFSVESGAAPGPLLRKLEVSISPFPQCGVQAGFPVIASGAEFFEHIAG